MGEVIVPTTGAVLVEQGTFGDGATPPVVVGAAPQWADNSDATYAEIETMETPGVTAVDRAFASLVRTPVELDPTIATLVARVRFANLAPDMAGPTVLVSTFGDVLIETTAQGPASLTPTWVDIPLTGAGLADTLFAISTTNTALTVRAPALRVQSRYVRTRIYEAYLVVTTPQSVAPPRDHYPRDDEYGTSSARQHYPSPKSVQRSNVHFGGYL